MQNLQATVNGLDINYYEYVLDGSDKIFVFLHGWGTNSFDWEGYFDELISCNISFIAIDLPGFGKTIGPGALWGIKEYSQLIMDFIDYKGMKAKQLIPVCHSFGARIGIRIAGNYKNYFDKMIWLAPSGVEKFISKLYKLLFGVADIVFKIPGFQDFGEYLKEILWSQTYRKNSEMKDVFLKVVNQDLTKCLKNINIPVYLYWGKEDKIIQERKIDKMQSIMSNLKVYKYENTGHDIHHTKRSIILEKIKEISA